MKIFSKLKDYAEELEQILDKKYFSGQIKNLLLSMLYRIDISYNDFARVKRVVRDKTDFVEDILNVIQKYCDNIKVVKPDSDQANLLEKNNILAVTNERERSALVYASEASLLYAIADIEPKYFYISPKFIFKNIMQRILVSGYILNTTEVLTSFNGWSWDTNKKDINDFEANLIYQNILLMFTEEFINDWRVYASSRRDFLSEMRMLLKEYTGTNDYFDTLCKILYKKESKKEKERIDAILKVKVAELKKMENREKYLSNAIEKRKKLTRTAEYIDQVLNSKELIIKELKKYNSKMEDKNKIQNVKTFCNMLENEKVKYLEEINELSFLLKPTNFLKKVSEYKAFEEILKNEKTIEEEMIELQKEFVLYFNKKINNIDDKEELIKILYILRYYKNLYISKKKKITDVEVLKQCIDKTMKKLITKLCKGSYIKILTMNIKDNFELLNQILDTKIIKLEDIKLRVEKSKENNNEYIVYVYDNEVCEKEISYIENGNNALEIKSKKLVKLFN